MNSITIIERIAMHQAAINNLTTIQQMMELEKEFAGKDISEATKIKNKAIEQYAVFMRLLCQTHVERALIDNEAYAVDFVNGLS